ncbi:hypothetical protein AOLI_G00166060 [Acnodon oligacanthus]
MIHRHCAKPTEEKSREALDWREARWLYDGCTPAREFRCTEPTLPNCPIQINRTTDSQACEEKTTSVRIDRTDTCENSPKCRKGVMDARTAARSGYLAG